jgi:hypothetical protein
MATPTILTWAGITVAGDGSSVYNLRSLTGWKGDLPPAQYDSDQRPNAHGTFGGPVWAGERTVSLVGECRTNTQRDALLNALDAATPFSGNASPGTLAVTMAGLSLTAAAQVIRSGRIRNPGEWGLGRFGFQIDWRCTDPLLYGTPVTRGPLVLAAESGGLVFPLFMPSGVLSWGTLPTPQQASLTNPGNADAPVTFTVAAGASNLAGGFQIIETSTGRLLRYVDDVPAGQSVVFNSADGSVLLNGDTDRRSSVTVAQWTPVPALSTRTFYLALLGGVSTTASLTAVMRPTYW